MDIEQLVDKEVQWLAKQEAATVSKLLDIYQEAFKELQVKLADMPEQSTYSRNHIKAIQAQLDVILSEMEAKQVDALSGTAIGVYRDEVLREHGRWEKLEELFGDPDVAKQFSLFKPIVPQGSIKALLLTHNVVIKNFSDDLTTNVRRSVAKGMIAGEGIPKIVKRLSTLDTGANRARLHLIARMETARASNEAKQETIEQLNKEFPELDLWQMVKDRVDRTAKTRNHWFSWAISGTVRNVTKNEYFEIHTAAMEAAKLEYTAITKRKAYEHGILWEKYSLGRRGKRIPAHYNDRAVVLPWRPSWDQSHFGTIKHPQGKIEGKNRANPNPEISSESNNILKERRTSNYLSSQNSNNELHKILSNPERLQKAKEHLTEMELNEISASNETLFVFDALKKLKFNPIVGKRNEIVIEEAVPVYQRGFIRNSDVSHNHLYGTSLSVEDVVFAAKYNLKSIKAYGVYKNKLYIYSFKRKGTDWRLNTDSAYNILDEKKSIHQLVESAGKREYQKAQGHFFRLSVDDKVKDEELDFLINSRTMNRLSEHINADYEVIIV